MARFINDTSHALTSFEHGWTVGPTGELDWPDYDEDTHGATPGLRRLDTPPKTRRKRADDQGGDPPSTDGAGSGTGADPGSGDPAAANDDPAAKEPTP